MQSDPPYVDIWRAVQIIAETLPGGEDHAKAMTRERIKGGFPYYETAPSPVLETFSKAAKILHQAVATPRVKVSVASGDGRRALADGERHFRLDLRLGFLADPNSATRLRNVMICAADLRAAPMKGDAQKTREHDGGLQPFHRGKLKPVTDWLRKKYPEGRPPGKSVDELLKEATAESGVRLISKSTLERAIKDAFTISPSVRQNPSDGC